MTERQQVQTTYVHAVGYGKNAEDYEDAPAADARDRRVFDEVGRLLRNDGYVRGSK